MAELGFTPRSVRDQTYVLAHLSRWLAAEDVGPSALTSPVVQRFLQTRRRAGRRRWVSVRSVRPLLDYLHRVGVAPVWEAPAPSGPVERLLENYRRYLLVERRLAPRTVRSHVDVARRFLASHAANGEVGTMTLAPSDVTGFVVAEGRVRRTGAMKVMVTVLRSLLRFLFLTGRTPANLAAAVPAVAGWSLTGLPKDVDVSTVAALLGSCVRDSAVGRRDHAILTLMARLGLRAAEIAGLQLDDIAWRTGELVVRGKGSRIDRLPIPADVGEVLADYVRHGRGTSTCRALFLRACAPDGAMTYRSVGEVPRSASTRAGLSIIGAHRLRHTAATQMLRGGASLADVAQVLRHHDQRTTALYAKVDRAALDLIARPWPGALR
jgi:site-specific recombinase XerD